MAETLKHPGDCVNKPIENDYFHNGHPNPSDPQFRWNGQDVTKRAPALTAAELQALRDAAPKKRATFAEHQREAQRTGVAVKPSVVVIGKNGTEKLQ